MLSRPELFQAILQDYQEILEMCRVGSQRDQGFYLFGHLLKLFHRFLRRIVAKSSFPCEED